MVLNQNQKDFFLSRPFQVLLERDIYNSSCAVPKYHSYKEERNSKITQIEMELYNILFIFRIFKTYKIYL